MWKITRDKLFENGVTDKIATGVSSRNYDGRKLDYKFRLKDDDGEIYYHGEANSNDDDKAFNPLDDFGAPSAGCTTIEYYNKVTHKWEIL